MSDLDNLFDKYKTRKKEEHEKETREHAEYSKSFQKTIAEFKKTILPILQEYKTLIEEQGYKSELREALEHGNAHVQLIFQPTPIAERMYFESTLSYYLRDVDQIVIGREIVGHGMNNRQYSDQRWKILDLSESKVRADISAFIEAVLKVN